MSLDKFWTEQTTPEMRRDFENYWGLVKSRLEEIIPEALHDQVEDLVVDSRAVFDPRPRLVFTIHVKRQNRIIFEAEI